VFASLTDTDGEHEIVWIVIICERRNHSQEGTKEEAHCPINFSKQYREEAKECWGIFDE
jgi:hypothetical protein